MKKITELAVRSYECDSYNHVNNAVYQNYLEYARVDYLNKVGFPYQEAVSKGYLMFVTHIDIYYKSSAHLDEKLFIETESVKLGAVRGTMHQIIRKEDDTVCVEADVTWACVKDGVPVRIPPEYMVPGLKPGA